MLPESFQPRAVNAPIPQREIQAKLRPELAEGIETISDYFEVISIFVRELEWWMRGEPKEYPAPGLPKFARDFVTGDRDPEELELLIEPPIAGNGKPVFVSCITRQEVEIVEAFKGNPPQDEYFEKLVGNSQDGVGWLAFAQHYGQSTRLLDVTRDPLVALFFACWHQENDDGFVWLYPDPTNLHQEYKPATYRETFDIGTGFAAQQGIEFWRQDRIDDYRSPRVEPPLEGPFLLKVEDPNKRIIAQRGAFLWSPKPLQALPINGFVFRVKAKAKANLISMLKSFGIHPKGLGLEP